MAPSPSPRRGSMGAVLALAAIVFPAIAIAAMSADDVIATRIWLDTHVFNMTLQAVDLDPGFAYVMSEQKARDNGLSWPVDWPTLCFVGLGQSSVEYLRALARTLPELQLVLIDPRSDEWLQHIRDHWGPDSNRVEVASLDDFAEARGDERRRCQAISWSVDSAPFSFYIYRELFYSVAYPLTLFNMQGCTTNTRHERKNKDDFYVCEYLFTMFKATVCGRLSEDKMVQIAGGRELYFPVVDSECAENLCMCSAHSDAFMDFHFEHLCRAGQPHRFMGQWNQDAFIVTNLFRPEHPRRRKGVYVDIGSSHPFALSNTAYLDSCLGWRGICVEPNPRATVVLNSLRSCRVVRACAWANETTMRFANGGELAARNESATLVSSEPFAQEAPAADTYFESRCAPLHDLLQDAGGDVFGPTDGDDWNKGRPIIDVLSIDAEGAELEILRGFPFNLWDVRVVVVEVSRRTNMAIDSLLLPLGFVKVAVLGKDALYASPSALAQPGGTLIDGGFLVPHTIRWNEPGTDNEEIDYMRFQRKFGIDGDLDVDVGDQRLENQTELERQAERLELVHNTTFEEILQSADSIGLSTGAPVGSREHSAARPEWVQGLLQDGEVKDALFHLATESEDAFREKLARSPRLRANVAKLFRAGMLTSSAAAAEAAAAYQA